jgi:hypothetical protein
MSRIDLLLNSALFQNARMRTALKTLIETRLNQVENQDFSITEFPIDMIFSNGLFNDEICLSIRDSKYYIDYEHHADDKIFQKIVFLSLIYSYNEFNQDQAWVEFLKEDYAYKRDKVTTGINRIWNNLQCLNIIREMEDHV